MYPASSQENSWYCDCCRVNPASLQKEEDTMIAVRWIQPVLNNFHGAVIAVRWIQPYLIFECRLYFELLTEVKSVADYIVFQCILPVRGLYVNVATVSYFGYYRIKNRGLSM